MLQISSKKVIDFYENNKHLNFNTINEVFVDILQNLMNNLSDNVDNYHNTQLLNELCSRMEKMEDNYSSQNSLIKNIQTDLTDIGAKMQKEMNSVLHHHKELLKVDIRETINSNTGNHKNHIETILNKNNENFSQKMELLFQNKELKQLVTDEISKVNTLIGNETSRLFTSFQDKNISSDGIVANMTEIINAKYSELDMKLKTQFDAFLSNNNSQNSSMFSELVDKIGKNNDVVDKVNDFLSGQNNSNKKGKQGEAKLEHVLSDAFPNASITNTSGQTSSGDFIVERKSKNKILIDTKDYKTVVPISEVTKLIKDIEKHDCHGILVSQYTGIAQKEHFEINIHKNNIIVFLHCANYDGNIIKQAANIIDQLEPHISSHHESTGQTISDDLLSDINDEYQQLVRQKSNLIETIKKNHNDLLQNLHDFDLHKLDGFLNTRFSNPGKINFRCDICNIFIGKNARSLALHKRKCIKVQQSPVLNVDTN
jgi:hypothetical protein